MLALNILIHGLVNWQMIKRLPGFYGRPEWFNRKSVGLIF